MRKRRTAHSAIVNGSTGSSFERGVIFSARRLHVDEGRKRKRPAYVVAGSSQFFNSAGPRRVLLLRGLSLAFEGREVSGRP